MSAQQMVWNPQLEQVLQQAAGFIPGDDTGHTRTLPEAQWHQAPQTAVPPTLPEHMRGHVLPALQQLGMVQEADMYDDGGKWKWIGKVLQACGQYVVQVELAGHNSPVLMPLGRAFLRLAGNGKPSSVVKVVLLADDSLKRSHVFAKGREDTQGAPGRVEGANKTGPQPVPEHLVFRGVPAQLPRLTMAQLYRLEFCVDMRPQTPPTEQPPPLTPSLQFPGGRREAALWLSLSIAAVLLQGAVMQLPTPLDEALTAAAAQGS
jgi:hypothetical protein